jgi:hypothetical protein
VGDAGVGKTALVEGIAQLMVAPDAPRGLVGKRLVSLDVGAMVAGSSFRWDIIVLSRPCQAGRSFVLHGQCMAAALCPQPPASMRPQGRV